MTMTCPRFAGVLLAILSLAGCGRYAMEREDPPTPCELSEGDCEPEEAQRYAPSDVVPGAALHLDCGIDASTNDVHQRACRKRVEHLLAWWHSRDPAFVLPEAGAIHVTTTEICLDTFISGQESADCQFFRVKAEIELPTRLNKDSK